MAKPSSEFFKSSSIQSSDEMIEASQFSMAMFKRKMSVHRGLHAREMVV